jgi:hypothetical protein
MTSTRAGAGWGGLCPYEFPPSSSVCADYFVQSPLRWYLYTLLSFFAFVLLFCSCRYLWWLVVLRGFHQFFFLWGTWYLS